MTHGTESARSITQRTSATSRDSTRLARGGLARLVLASAIMFAGGCASTPAKESSRVPTGDRPNFQSKRASLFGSLIEKQKTAPDSKVRNFTPTDADLSSRLAPLSNEDLAKALLPLEEVLKSIPQPTLPKPAVALQPVSETDQVDAMVRYLSGREKLADGKFTDALDDLVGATKLDPMSPEPHRALAEANLGLGRTSAAMKSFREAAARGSEEPRLCWVLGRDALKSGNSAEAAAFLKVARAKTNGASDRTLLTLIECDLAEALGNRGNLLAMVELRSSALEHLTDAAPPPSMRSEFADLFRKSGELLLSNGDALARIGKFEESVEQYSAAESTGLVDQSAANLRWITTLLRQGHSAEVADRLLAEAFEKPERLDSSRIALIPVLARSQAGDGLRAGFAELLSQDRPGSVSLLIARAAAAAAETQRESRGILAAGLTRYTPDPDTLAAYLAMWPEDDVAGRVDAVKQLITGHPFETGRYSQAFAAEGHDPKAIQAALESDQTLAGGLLMAHMLAAWGDFEAAAVKSRALTVPSDAALARAVYVARGELSVQTGDWATADWCLTALAKQDNTESRLAQSNILRGMQRYSPAWAILEKEAGPSSSDDPAADRPKLEVLLRGAELIARMGKPDVAMELLKRAVAADPHDDRSYGGMAAIISATPPIDQQKLGAVVHEVREKCPAGRSMRGLMVQQSLASESSFESPAVNRLIALVQQIPQDASIIDQLATFSERNAARLGSDNRVLKALSGVLAKRPGSLPVRYAIAQVQVASKQADAAIATLDQLPDPIRDAQTQRLKEKILRDDLKKPDEAKALEARRLAAPSPGINPAIEAADQLWRSGKEDDAIRRLQVSVAPGAELDSEQQAKLLFMGGRAMGSMSRLPEDPRQGKTLDGQRALAIFDLVGLHGGKMLPQHHWTRIILLGVNAPDDFPRLMAATELGGTQFPDQKLAFIARAVEAVGTEVPRRGNEFLKLALAKLSPPPPELLRYLIAREIEFGTLEDMQKTLDLVEAPGQIDGVLTELDSRMEPNATLEQKQAELLYAVASGYTSKGDDATAEAIYRRSLAKNPEHGLSNNDLGYALLEKGRIDEAAPMIEAAARILKDRSHVLDSLGWLRYKQGRMADAPAGSQEGAITILKRAIDLANGNEAAMLDHLGDAYWANGDRVDAAESWSGAQRAADQMLLEIRASSATRTSFVKELKMVEAAAIKKLAAYKDKKEPEIAPYPGRKEPGTPLQEVK